LNIFGPTIELEYVLDTPCNLTLEGVSLIAKGKYSEVTPETVALRLMEDQRDGYKEVGLILQSRQDIQSEVVELVQGSVKNFIPGRSSEIRMSIHGILFPYVSLDDFMEIFPDVSRKDFRGILVNCSLNAF
jgi:hypothetical protein